MTESKDLAQRVEKLESELKHWKSNHAAEVQRARVLKERTDMPLERVQAYEQIGQLLAERDALAAELTALRKQEPVGIVDEGDDGVFADLETTSGVIVKLGGKLYAHPVPAESAIESSHKHLEPWQPIETAPHDEVLLLACEFDGPGDWRIKCGYFDDDLGGWKVWGASWVPTRWAAIPAPPNLSDAARRDQAPAKVSPCAGHAVQQDADEAKICAACRFLTKNGGCQSKGTSYNCVDYCQWEANESGGT